jgi:hypothetical protein
MKKLLFTLVVFSVLLVSGCQENSITDPIQFGKIGEIQKTSDQIINSGIIPLEGMLKNPYPVMNSYYIINGKIQYQHTLQTLDPIPPNHQYAISLDLLVSANFSDFCSVCEPQTTSFSAGTISIKTNNIIYMSEDSDGIYLLEKSFPIQGRTDGMVLMCRFNVTTDSIALNAMWLKLPDINDINTNQTNNL